ncbi:MAG: DUF2007 domain-containing protein [Verrucomicrobiia bacterium]
MTTVGEFTHQAEASLALSRLQAAGIDGFLFDEISLAVVGAGTTAIPVRLEVSDEDAERAGRILRGGEGAGPLPYDFSPPEQAEVVEGNFTKVTGKAVGSAFIMGGVLTLITLGLPALAAMVSGAGRVPSIGGLLVMFVIGGVVGVIVHICREGLKEAEDAKEKPCGDLTPPGTSASHR